MTIFDLLFLVSVLGIVLALIGIGIALVLRQWKWAQGVAVSMGSYLVLYAVILVSVALLSPQHIYTMGQDRCFDDWCVTAIQATQQPTIGTATHTVTARGHFVLVTAQVTSRAKRISQRAVDAAAYLLDGSGQRYTPDGVGQAALDSSGQGGQPLDSDLPPGGSFTRTLVFDLPANATQLDLVVTHGIFPDVVIIGSDQSFFHRPTIIRLTLS